MKMSLRNFESFRMISNNDLTSYHIADIDGKTFISTKSFSIGPTLIFMWTNGFIPHEGTPILATTHIFHRQVYSHFSNISDQCIINFTSEIRISIYVTGKEALISLKKTNKSQWIVITGESASEKTITTNHLTHFLCNSRDLSTIAAKSNIVLEAFGNKRQTIITVPAS